MIAAAMARAMPVFPLVASINVSPGLISPRSCARVIIDSAGRSFTEPAGLLPSSLTRMTLLVLPGRRLSFTRGVFPTKSSMVLNMTCTTRKRPRPDYSGSGGRMGGAKRNPSITDGLRLSLHPSYSINQATESGLLSNSRFNFLLNCAGATHSYILAQLLDCGRANTAYLLQIISGFE